MNCPNCSVVSLKRILRFALLPVVLFCLCGCGKETLSIDFSEQNFSNICSIILTNAHNGKQTIIEDVESVNAICVFIKSTKGKEGGSAKGYYEGSYSLSLHEDTAEEAVFRIGYGDSDAFFYGEYGDGYPVRYLLDGMTIDDAISFLQQYDDYPIS